MDAAVSAVALRDRVGFADALAHVGLRAVRQPHRGILGGVYKVIDVRLEP